MGGGHVWKSLHCTDLGALQVGEGQERTLVALVLSSSLLSIRGSVELCVWER